MSPEVMRWGAQKLRSWVLSDRGGLLCTTHSFCVQHTWWGSTAPALDTRITLSKASEIDSFWKWQTFDMILNDTEMCVTQQRRPGIDTDRGNTNSYCVWHRGVTQKVLRMTRRGKAQGDTDTQRAGSWSCSFVRWAEGEVVAGRGGALHWYR